MGTLYWQINDLWPVFSWSSVDGYGQWKPMHYMVKKYYEEVMLAVRFDKSYQLFAVNDFMQDVSGTVTFTLMSFTGEVKY